MYTTQLFLAWLKVPPGDFKTIRIFHEFDLLRGRKFAIVDEEEIPDRTLYAISTEGEEFVPAAPGDYPVEDFKNVVFMADFADRNGYIKPTVHRDVLYYKPTLQTL